MEHNVRNMALKSSFGLSFVVVALALLVVAVGTTDATAVKEVNARRRRQEVGDQKTLMSSSSSSSSAAKGRSTHQHSVGVDPCRSFTDCPTCVRTALLAANSPYTDARLTVLYISLLPPSLHFFPSAQFTAVSLFARVPRLACLSVLLRRLCRCVAADLHGAGAHSGLALGAVHAYAGCHWYHDQCTVNPVSTYASVDQSIRSSIVLATGEGRSCVPLSS